LEPPSACGTTEPPKTLLVNPYQLPAHGRLPSGAGPSTRMLSRDATFCFTNGDSFGNRVLADCRRKTVAQSGRGANRINGNAKVYM
jgi:hypothetical protein